MRIAIVTPFGAEPRLDNFAEFILAKKFQEAGHSVRFYTYRKSDDPLYRHNLTYKGIQVARCRQRFGLAPWLFFSIVFFRPQVVLYFHPKSLLSFTAYYAARACGAKTISEVVGILHDPFLVGDTDDPVATLKTNPLLATTWQDFWHWRNFVVHKPTGAADVIVAINKEEQTYIQRFYHRKSELIHWSVPQPNDERKSEPLATGNSLPDQFLLFIAQVKKRKGWDTVLEALAKLKQQGIEKHLVFVCPNTDVSAAQKYAVELGVERQITYFSGVSNEQKNWLYERAAAVLAPSRYEGFGLPVFEAFAAGKPVLTTDLPVYQELLTPKVDALISPIGNAAALADNIKVLDSDPGLSQRLIEGGYKTVARFTKEVMAEKFLKLISSLVTAAD